MTDNKSQNSGEGRTLRNIRERVFKTIQIGYTADTVSKIFDIVIAGAILINLFLVFFETFDISAPYLPILDFIELITVVIFTAEYILRLLTADFLYPNEKKKWISVLRFVFSLYGIIDLASFLPYWLPIVFPSGIVAFRMLRVIRILRLFRINAYYDAFNVITDVIKQKKNQILSAVFIILMMVMASSLIMYNLEHDAQPDSFNNAFSGIWWAVSTLLTVGYGDIYPITNAGKFVGIVLAFLGVGIVAIPTGIISAGFVEQYSKIRDLAGTSEEYPVNFISITITKSHPWAEKKVAETNLVPGIIFVAILRGNETLLPNGSTLILEGDRVVLGAESLYDEPDIDLEEIIIKEGHEWEDKKICELGLFKNLLIVLIKRGKKGIIPNGNTVIKKGDLVVVFQKKERRM